MKSKLLIVVCFAAAGTITLSGQSLTGEAASATEASQTQKLPGDDVTIPSVDEKWGQAQVRRNARPATK